MTLPDVGLGGPSGRRGHNRGHQEELAPPYRGQRVVLGPQSTGPQDGATSGGHELEHAAGANVGDDAGATIRVDVGQSHEELPEAELEGHTMATSERLWIAARYWGHQARASMKAKAKAPGGIYHAQPESLAQHDERVARHEWVPEGYEGKWLQPLGVAHHQTFGKFGMVTGYVWAWIWDHPLAFYPLLILSIILSIWIRYS